jgi:hypothetical protein
MGKYAILKTEPAVTPAPTSVFDFIGGALPMLMPLAMGALGIVGAPALAMHGVACVPDIAALSGGQRTQAMPQPHRPMPLARSRLARQGWQRQEPRFA